MKRVATASMVHPDLGCRGYLEAAWLPTGGGRRQIDNLNSRRGASDTVCQSTVTPRPKLRLSIFDGPVVHPERLFGTKIMIAPTLTS